MWDVDRSCADPLPDGPQHLCAVSQGTAPRPWAPPWALLRRATRRTEVAATQLPAPTPPCAEAVVRRTVLGREFNISEPAWRLEGEYRAKDFCQGKCHLQQLEGWFMRQPLGSRTSVVPAYLPGLAV